MALAIQRSFAYGEVGPSVAARADLPFYSQALRTCRNFFVQRHGGIANRQGTQYIATLKTSANRSVLLAAVFADDAAYVIEAGHLYFRFYKNGARVTVSGVTAWSNATNYVVGDLAVTGGVNYYCILAHTNQAPPNATYWYALTGSIFEIPTPYTIAQVGSVRLGGPATDRLTVVHPSHSVRELRRTADTTWTLTLASFDPAMAAPTGLANGGGAGATYAWVVTAVDLVTGEESLASAATTSATDPAATPVTLTWNAVAGAGSYHVYRQRNGLYGFVARAGSATYIDNVAWANVDTAHTPPVSRSTIFSHGFAGNNEPRTITYYQQRQVFGGTENQPDFVAASRTGYRTNFSISNPLQDDDAISFKVTGRRYNVVRHVLEVGELFVLTSGTIWIVEGDADGVVLPNAINLRPQTYHGAAGTPPIIVGSTLVYVQAGGSVVRDLRPGQSVEVPTARYHSRDLTVLSAHLFTGYTIDRLAYAETPHSIAWAIRSDGTLLGLTYLPDFDSFGWHRHDTAGGTFEEVVTVPEGNEDAVYVQVLRTINGTPVRYLERLASRVIANAVTDSRFVDGHVAFSGAATTVSGLDHLEGETVWALIDGNRQGPFTVSGGTVTLSRAAVTGGVVGLRITAEAELLDLDAAGANVRDQRKRIGGLALLVEASQPAEGLTAGPDADHAARQFIPTVLPTYGSPAALYSGRIEMGIGSTWNAHGRVFIRNIDPVPICVLAALPFGELGG